MKELIVAKASGTMPEDVTEDVTLRIEERVPEFQRSWEAQYQVYFNEQAAKVLEALRALPGGTLDRLLSKLLDYKASLHRIPWEKPR